MRAIPNSRDQTAPKDRVPVTAAGAGGARPGGACAMPVPPEPPARTGAAPRAAAGAAGVWRAAACAVGPSAGPTAAAVPTA